MNYENISIRVDYRKVGAIHTEYQPTMTTYVLDSFQDKLRPAVVICAGGGYESRSPREGEPIAMRFLAAGINAFVLHYSVAPARYPSAVLELAAAVMTVRENAEQWGVDASCVFIAGFSAGGHLCATLGTLWDEPLFTGALKHNGIDKPWKPSGAILGYPVISMTETPHIGSRLNLLGEDATAEDFEALSLEKRVTGKTVPVFLWHTAEDKDVPVEHALMFGASLCRARVPFEMHIFESGVHGLALCDVTTATEKTQIVPENGDWIRLAILWMTKHKDAVNLCAW